MNEPSRPLDAAIERLVDGEVAPDERRAILALLEESPAGWRKCALAFLEAQAWREALAAPTLHLTQPTTTSPLPARRFRWAAIGASAAAGLLLTFTLGILVGSAGRGGDIRHAAPPSFADSGARPKADLPMPTGTDAGPFEAGGEVASVPILDPSEIDESWWDDSPQPLPEYVRSNLERSGYRVEQHRSLVAVDLEDGRRVAVPVDQVDLQFTAPEPN